MPSNATIRRILRMRIFKMRHLERVINTDSAGICERTAAFYVFGRLSSNFARRWPSRNKGRQLNQAAK